MPLLIVQLDMSNNEPEFDELGAMDAGYSVVNNACWSCGEIALKQGSFCSLTYEKRIYTDQLI